MPSIDTDTRAIYRSKKHCENSKNKFYYSIYEDNYNYELINKKDTLEFTDNINQPFNFLDSISSCANTEIVEKNMSIAFNNIYLSKQIGHAQKEILFTLSNICETHSKEINNHIIRVAEYSKLLALKYGMNNKNARIIGLASSMHDIGKLSIPDYILNKPSKLTEEEFEIMKTHSTVGYNILKNSNEVLLKVGAIIALEHHERYDGTGYPYGIKREKIHIAGRITAIADVFDALCSKRVYKQAWSIDKILNHLRELRGKHFDPFLIDVFIKNIDEILSIKNSLIDS